LLKRRKPRDPNPTFDESLTFGQHVADQVPPSAEAGQLALLEKLGTPS